AACSSESPEAPPPASSASSSSARPALEVRQVTDAEAEKAAATIAGQVNLVPAEGLDVQLWASEKLLGDPVAISVDNQGRLWATVTNRSNNSEFDIRGYPQWEFPSVAFRSVADRRQFLRRERGPGKSRENSRLADRIRHGAHDWVDLAVEKEEGLMQDARSGDGRAPRGPLFLRVFSDDVKQVLGGRVFDNLLDEVFLD